MKLRVRLGAAFVGVMLSLLVASGYEFAFEPHSATSFSLLIQDLRLAVLEYRSKKYSVKTWVKRIMASPASSQSFPELQAFVIKRT